MSAGVTLYPNPSEHSFTWAINYPKSINELEIQVTDINGILIFEQKKELPSGDKIYQHTWNASNVANGIYFYKIILDKDRVVTGKMVKM